MPQIMLEELSEEEFLKRLAAGTLKRQSDMDEAETDAQESDEIEANPEDDIEVPMQDFASLFSGMLATAPAPEPAPKPDTPKVEATKVKPAEVKPAEVKPAEVKPAEVKPTKKSNSTSETTNAQETNKSSITKFVVVGIAAVLLIIGVIAGMIISNNNHISDLLSQTIQKERKIAETYPSCTKSAALIAGTNSGLYRLNPTDNSFEATTNSANDLKDYIKSLDVIEQTCANEKAQKEAEEIAAAEQARLAEERAKLEAEKQAAETRAREAQIAAQHAQALAEVERQMRIAAEQQAQQAAPVDPATRLTPQKAVKYEKFKHYSWLIMYDNVLKKPCHIITNSKYPIMQEKRWCIPFSGLEEDLNDTFAATVAMNYADRKICKTGQNKSPSNGQTRDAYCSQMFNDLQNQATRENWASFSEICRLSNDPQIKEYCGYLF